MRSLLRPIVALLLLAGACDAFNDGLLFQDSGPGDRLARRPTPLPPRPSSSVDGDNGQTYVTALRGVVLDMREDVTGDPRCDGLNPCRLGDIVGLDLDGFDTTATNGLTECHPVGSSIPRVDGASGIDNFFGREFFTNVSLVLPTFEADARTSQQNGEGTIVVQLTGWNGTANDYQVRVVIMQAIDGTSEDPNTVTLVAGDSMMGIPPHLVKNSDGVTDADPPGWAGNDTWWVRRDNFAVSDFNRPLIVDANAWISSGTLVLKLPDRQDILFFSADKGVPVRLTGAYAVVTLNPAFDGNVDEVVIAGRWHLNDLLSIADYVNICMGIREILDMVLGANADVRSEPVDIGEVNDPSLECDAVSMAALFDEGVVGREIRLDASIAPLQLTDFCN